MKTDKLTKSLDKKEENFDNMLANIIASNMKYLSENRESVQDTRKMNGYEGCVCQPIINVTVNPVIHTTSRTTEKTKNSPLSELGNVLSFIPSILQK